MAGAKTEAAATMNAAKQIIFWFCVVVGLAYLAI